MTYPAGVVLGAPGLPRHPKNTVSFSKVRNFFFFFFWYVKLLCKFSPGNFHEKKESFCRKMSEVLVQSYLLNVRV